MRTPSPFRTCAQAENARARNEESLCCALAALVLGSMVVLVLTAWCS